MSGSLIHLVFSKPFRTMEYRDSCMLQMRKWVDGLRFFSSANIFAFSVFLQLLDQPNRSQSKKVTVKAEQRASSVVDLS